MKISVVIPCHNCGPWVQDALKSVVAQTYPAHEIVVIDDGSHDNSLEKIRTSGADVKLLRTQFGNAAAARNEGVHHASGDWIAFLDADDVWYPHHLTQAATLLERGEDVAYLAHNDQLRCDAKKEGVFVKRDTHPPVEYPTGGLSDATFFSWWARQAWFCTCTTVVRRDVFLAAGGFDATQKRRHDFEMFLRVIHGKTWAYNPVAGMAYRFQLNPRCISSNILETSYFTLRGLLKNRALYDGEMMARAIRVWAVRTAKHVVLSGDKAETERAWRLCWPYLRAFERAVFGFGRENPKLVFAARNIKKRLLGCKPMCC